MVAAYCLDAEPAEDLVVLRLRVGTDSEWGSRAGGPSWLRRALCSSSFVSLSRDPDQLLSVTVGESFLKEVELPSEVEVERNWATLRLSKGSLKPQVALGALASLCLTLQKAGLDPYPVSTLDSEQLLLRTQDMHAAAAALLAVGHAIAPVTRFCPPAPRGGVPPLGCTSCAELAGAWILGRRERPAGTLIGEWPSGGSPIRLQASCGLFAEVHPATSGSLALGSCAGCLEVAAAGTARHRMVDLRPPSGEAAAVALALDGNVLTEGSRHGGLYRDVWVRPAQLQEEVVALLLLEEVPSRQTQRWGLWIFCGRRFVKVVGLPRGRGLVSNTCCLSLAQLQRLKGETVRKELETEYEVTCGIVEEAGLLREGRQQGSGQVFLDVANGEGGTVKVTGKPAASEVVHLRPDGTEQRWQVVEWGYDPFTPAARASRPASPGTDVASDAGSGSGEPQKQKRPGPASSDSESEQKKKKRKEKRRSLSRPKSRKETASRSRSKDPDKKSGSKKDRTARSASKKRKSKREVPSSSGSRRKKGKDDGKKVEKKKGRERSSSMSHSLSKHGKKEKVKEKEKDKEREKDREKEQEKERPREKDMGQSEKGDEDEEPTFLGLMGGRGVEPPVRSDDESQVPPELKARGGKITINLRSGQPAPTNWVATEKMVKQSEADANRMAAVDALLKKASAVTLPKEDPEPASLSELLRAQPSNREPEAPLLSRGTEGAGVGAAAELGTGGAAVSEPAAEMDSTELASAAEQPEGEKQGRREGPRTRHPAEGGKASSSKAEGELLPANFPFPEGYPPPPPPAERQQTRPGGGAGGFPVNFPFPQGYPPPPEKQGDSAGLPMNFPFPQGYPPPPPPAAAGSDGKAPPPPLMPPPGSVPVGMPPMVLVPAGDPSMQGMMMPMPGMVMMPPGVFPGFPLMPPPAAAGEPGVPPPPPLMVPHIDPTTGLMWQPPPPGPPPLPPAPANNNDEANPEGLNQFLKENKLDHRAAAALRALSPEMQQKIVAEGPVTGSNPSAVLTARIRKMEAQSGGGEGASASLSSAPSASEAQPAAKEEEEEEPAAAASALALPPPPGAVPPPPSYFQAPPGAVPQAAAPPAQQLSAGLRPLVLSRPPSPAPKRSSSAAAKAPGCGPPGPKAAHR